MVRWLGMTGVVVVAMAAVGCGGSVQEIAPVKEAAGVIGDPREKAMQSMPADMRKKMEAQQQKK